MQNDFIDDLRNKEEKSENYFVFMKSVKQDYFDLILLSLYSNSLILYFSTCG